MDRQTTMQDMATDAQKAVRVTCLGTGTSHGIPMIACDCAVCTSEDPRDRRSRPCITVSYDQKTVLIDTPPELRLQCIAYKVRRVDAVLFTHHHADHVAGLDDLRRFNWVGRTRLDCYGPAATLERIRQMFCYAFQDDPEYPSHKPDLHLVPLDGTAFDLFGRSITPIPLMHGPMPVLGYRIGRFAYCTDCNFIPEASWPLLAGLDVLILDALRHTPHPTHFNLAQAVETAQRIGAARTYFTHIAHELSHAKTNADLPPGMALAYDGLAFEAGG